LAPVADHSEPSSLVTARRPVRWPRLGVTLLVAVVMGVTWLSAQADGAAAGPLRARHGAVGNAAVPRGWLPFSFGYIQMAVRPNWDVWYTQSAPLQCPTDFAGPVTLIYTSPSPNNAPRPDCAGERSDTTVLVWYPASLLEAKALRHQRINGIEVDGPRVVGKWQELSLPTLRFVIYTKGPEAPAVLHTLTYSARAALAKLSPAPAVPADWGWLAADGLLFAAPSNWPVDHLATKSAGSGTDGPLWVQPRTVVLYSGGEPADDDVFVSMGGTALGLGYDSFDEQGAVVSSPPLAPIGTEYITGPTPAPCARIHTLKICLSPGDNTLYGPALYTIRRPGARRLVTLTVGLSGDGLVARTIIGSFRPS